MQISSEEENEQYATVNHIHRSQLRARCDRHSCCFVDPELEPHVPLTEGNLELWVDAIVRSAQLVIELQFFSL
jgi:hypothetical protein